MQACYEIETDIPPSHQLSIQLPGNIPVGRARISILYEAEPAPAPTDLRMTQFLNSLPENPSGGLSREAISAHVQQPA